MSSLDQKQLYRERIEANENYRDYLVDSVGVWGPLLAPLVPAGLTMISIALHYPALLNIPVWAAWGTGVIVAVVIEVLGIVSVETYLSMATFNQGATDDSERAPAGWAGLIMGLYVGIVVSLVILLKMIPALALVSLLPLTLLAVVTSWIVVLRKQHRARLHRIEMAELETTRKADLSAKLDAANTTIDELSAETERLNDTIQELDNDIAMSDYDRQGLRDLADMLTRRVNGLMSELDSRNSDNNPGMSGFHGVDSGTGNRAKQDKRDGNIAMLTAWLSVNPGSKKSDIAKMFVSNNVQISDKTISRYLSDIGAIRNGHKWSLPEHELTAPVTTNGSH